jgi:DNA replication protein DnaC
VTAERRSQSAATVSFSHFVYNGAVSKTQAGSGGMSGCPECKGSGWIHLVKDGIAGVQRCDCFRQSRIERLIANARIPARYAQCELHNFELIEKLKTQSLEFAKLAAEKFVEEFPGTTPMGLLFMGPQGVGKTHLAVGIIKALMRRKAIQCMFRAFNELLREIQMSYSPISESSELSLLAPILDTDVLVLDELGALSIERSLWVHDTVTYILNYRYSENKVTIFTTNYLDESMTTSKGRSHYLVDRIGPQMRSRLYEMCKTIVMNGNDFRQNVMGAEYRQFKKGR